MRTFAFTLLASLVLLAGCGAAPAAPVPPPPEPFTVPTSPASTPAPTVVLSSEEEELFGPRVELPGGLLLKEFGKVAQWGQSTNVREWGIRVIVDEVLIDPKCDEYTPPPERGHRLVLNVRVETSERFDPALDGGPDYYKWSVTGPDGVTEAPSSTSYGCVGAEELPFELRPSAQYRGQVVLDSRYDSGQLVLDNFFAWNFPVSVA